MQILSTACIPPTPGKWNIIQVHVTRLFFIIGQNPFYYQCHTRWKITSVTLRRLWFSQSAAHVKSFVLLQHSATVKVPSQSPPRYHSAGEPRHPLAAGESWPRFSPSCRLHRLVCFGLKFPSAAIAIWHEGRPSGRHWPPFLFPPANEFFKV